MTVVSCSVDERYVNPLFEVFDGGDLILSSYRDVEDSLTTMRIFVPDAGDAPRAAEALAAAGRVVGIDLAPEVGEIADEDWKLAYRRHFRTEVVSPRLALVPDAGDAPRAAEALAAAGRVVGIDLAPEVGEIADEDWKLAYRRHFRTEVVSPRLALVPEWELDAFRASSAPAENPGIRALVLDPGMAFGTGQHATTRACLEYIDALALEGRDRSFLDVGCGSGILAIAASLEGFRDVAGFDIDPDAVENANENAARNGLDLRFARADLCNKSTLPGVARTGSRAFDVVAANVLGPILARFAGEIAPLVAPGGRLILSGILDEIYSEVRSAYEAQGFRELSSRLLGEWRTGLFARDA